MKPIKYDYIKGPLTIQWIPPEVRVAKIRCHVDEKVMPGPTRYTALIEHYPEERLFELTMLSKSKDAMDGPYLCEHRSVIDYMHDCFSAIGLWRRAKGGAVKVVANVRGNGAQNVKKEIVKMAQVNVKMDYVKNPVGDATEGKIGATITAQYFDLEYADVVKIQGAVVNSLQGLGEAAAAAPATA